MNKLAIAWLSTILLTLACGGAPKSAQLHKPPVTEPEPPPEPKWESSAENCEKFLGKIIELARGSGEFDDEKLAALQEEYSGEQATQDCINDVSFEQFDCVMSTEKFGDLARCQQDSGGDED